jgi:hypothetical protein
LYLAARMQPEQVRGTTTSTESSRLLAPSGVIDTTRPRFRWTEVRGATYTITVIDGLTVVARSPRLTLAEWPCDRDLARGRVYSWQLHIIRGATKELVPLPPRPPALFAIVASEASSMLAAARQSTPDDHLALGVLAARAGLREDAIAELTQAAAEHPNDAAILSLLQSVHEWPAHG